jgi:5'-3' exoribonuclease 2
MNQQRGRRFQASKEVAKKREEIFNIRTELKNRGVSLPVSGAKEEHFDSNCITPGTPFMARLAVAFRYYIHLRITASPAWQNLVVSFTIVCVNLFLFV